MTVEAVEERVEKIRKYIKVQTQPNLQHFGTFFFWGRATQKTHPSRKPPESQ